MRLVRVLVVDDSLTIRAMMRQVLESDPEIRIAGMAASADEADAMLEDGLVDVITLDVEMPGRSGLDFLRDLRTRRSTPVIMLSSYTARGEEMRAQALLDGAVGCFNKANAVKEKDRLLRLVKDAAHREARLDREDAAAVKEMRATH
jgi:two-component system, chemotaxis family, protein-glutamate methylesterase/glutaminase